MSARIWYASVKRNLTCAKCDESHPDTLDFHHKKGVRKTDTVSRMVRKGYSKIMIIEEMNKCEVLCANCHRKHHSRDCPKKTTKRRR